MRQVIRIPLTPIEAAAFHKLGVLRGDDLSRIAMDWLELGANSASVSVLAGERDATLRDHGDLFRRALCELGLVGELGDKAATWLFVRRLLSALVNREVDVRSAAGAIIDTARDAAISLFEPRYLAGGGKAFAGEELGIEVLLGLYYELENDELLSRDAKANEREMFMEAWRVLKMFYTEPPVFEDAFDG